MAIGKNKKLGKKKRGVKKIDPFTKKEWYVVKAPNIFANSTLGQTVVTKTAGTKIARDSLMGRVFESSLGDLKEDAEDEAFRKFSFRVEDVQGNQCLTSFNGMDVTTDKLRMLVRKWHSLIEATVDVKTADGYTLRIFALGFTKSHAKQRRKTTYAQSSQIRAIRKKMTEIMTREASSCDLNEFVSKLVAEIIGREIEKATQGIYPLQNVLVRKVKVLKAPKIDISKLMESHGGSEAIAAAVAASGQKVERPEDNKSKTQKKKDKATAKKKATKAGDESDADE